MDVAASSQLASGCKQSLQRIRAGPYLRKEKLDRVRMKVRRSDVEIMMNLASRFRWSLAMIALIGSRLEKFWRDDNRGAAHSSRSLSCIHGVVLARD